MLSYSNMQRYNEGLPPLQQSLYNRGKRGPEDLMLSNGNGIGSPMESTDIMNDAKKVRLESSFPDAKPSKVIHIRNVPQEATETDIVHLGVPFGSMTNMVLAKKKNQALLEMESVESAVSMVDYYNCHAPQVRARNVIIQFSNHEELRTEQQNSAADSALKAANNLINTQSCEEPKCVLRVIVENLLCPVTIETLHKIFTRFGGVQKIVTFNKNNTFQALIQMGSTVEAHSAKLNLNGQNIYTGCNTLRIDFSKLNALNVKYNNEKSRDFTAVKPADSPGLDMMPPPMASPLGSSNLGMFQANKYNSQQDYSQEYQQQDYSGEYASEYQEYSGDYGNHWQPHRPGDGTPPSLLEQPPPPPHFRGAQQHQMNSRRRGHPDNSGSMSGLTSPGLPFGAMMLPHAAAAAAGLAAMNTVLLVSNLDEEKVTPDALFTLFGVYGDVQRVKIMFAKKDNALVQFTDGQQAQLALQHLNGVKMWDKPLKIAYSKHTQVQMPKEGADAGLTKDYSNSPLHRFKKPNSKNFQNIFGPSAVLHLSNIPPDAQEDSIKSIFVERGYDIAAFKFFQKDKKMALIQLPTIEEAIHALIELHNYQLNENFHLRVSFSKSVI